MESLVFSGFWASLVRNEEERLEICCLSFSISFFKAWIYLSSFPDFSTKSFLFSSYWALISLTSVSRIDFRLFKALILLWRSSFSLFFREKQNIYEKILDKYEKIQLKKPSKCCESSKLRFPFFFHRLLCFECSFVNNCFHSFRFFSLNIQCFDFRYSRYLG